MGPFDYSFNSNIINGAKEGAVSGAVSDDGAVYTREMDVMMTIVIGKKVSCNVTTKRVVELNLDLIRDRDSENDWYLNDSLFLPFQELHNLSLFGFERLSRLGYSEQIYLTGNNFNNDILSSLTGLSSLIILYLGDNKLKATLNVEELREIHLFKNKLEGPLRNGLYDSPELIVLDLSHNNLGGRIPKWMGKFSREIPLDFGTLFTVKALNLSHNSLTGPIPSTFSNLTAIESLDLSWNNLNREIPSQLTQLNSLEVFSVAHNNLSGKTQDSVAQFVTSEQESMKENPLLCGLPLPNSCTPTSPPPMTPTTSMDENEDNGCIDMDVFYASLWCLTL
ncbi:receptor-like protein 56 [Ricinus communis]|uniref:receptor-like protein 56 n=1 Tax=Ricinus communis TaxID=3988 RepID=UPI00201A9638|nr:receptor-like protein 56 [Ricinus communis]